MIATTNGDGSPHCATLTPQQGLAVYALASGCNLAAAARQASADRTTVSRWFHHDPEFAQALDGERREIAQRVRDRVVAGILTGVDSLIEIASDKTLPASERRHAAGALVAVGRNVTSLAPTAEEALMSPAEQYRQNAIAALREVEAQCGRRSPRPPST